MSLKIEDIQIVENEPGQIHLEAKGKKYRVTEDAGELVAQTHVSKVHAKGHPVDYWKTVRPNSHVRATLESYARVHMKPRT